FKELDRNKGGGAAKSTAVGVGKTPAGKPVMETSPSLAGPPAASSLGGLAASRPGARGAREGLGAFAGLLPHGNEKDYHEPARLSNEEREKDPQAKALVPRCRGEVALADAVIALTSNIAMAKRRLIEFDEKWFDYKSDEVPDGSSGEIASR